MSQQNWLVCGCDSAFGDHLVRTILHIGDRVIATAPDVEAIRHLEAMGATILPLNITEDPTELERKIRQISIYFGRLDVVVQNAGLGPLGALEDLSPQVLGSSFNTYAFGVLNLSRAIFQNLRRQESGYVALISSVASWGNAPGMGTYQSAKAAVDGIIRTMAAELQPSGIKTLILQLNQGTSDQTTHAGASSSDPQQAYQPPVDDPQRLVSVLVNIVKSDAAPRHKSMPLELDIGPNGCQWR